MSTRCCIKVVRDFSNTHKEVMLYHHHDGYPEGVGVDLKIRAKKWTPSWSSGDRAWDIDTVVNSLIKDDHDEYEYTACEHTDIEYLYTINCNNKTIKCNECEWVFEDEKGNLVDENVVGDEVSIPDPTEEK